MAVSSTPRILINGLLLSQCSGGYRSYFKNVIIPLAHSLNEQNIFTCILIPVSHKNEYECLFSSEQLIIDKKNKKGVARILYEHSQIPYLVKKHNFTKVY